MLTQKHLLLGYTIIWSVQRAGKSPLAAVYEDYKAYLYYTGFGSTLCRVVKDGDTWGSVNTVNGASKIGAESQIAVVREPGQGKNHLFISTPATSSSTSLIEFDIAC